MKTTNLEISQKLKELGFESESEIVWYQESHGMNISQKESEKFQLRLINGSKHLARDCIKSYDLETILEALPKKIERENIKLNCSYALWSHKIKFFHDNLGEYQIEKKENESLANTAGRLLVKLLEDNIIKLGE
jgi:hypothetical protein